MPKRAAPDDRVYRPLVLVVKAILADDNPAEVAQREWLARRLDEVGARLVASLRRGRLVSRSGS